MCILRGARQSVLVYPLILRAVLVRVGGDRVDFDRCSFDFAGMSKHVHQIAVCKAWAWLDLVHSSVVLLEDLLEAVMRDMTACYEFAAQ
jgi:hypothetical protein